MNDNDYWDDDYYYKHSHEYGRSSTGVSGPISAIIFIFGFVIAIICPPVGALFMLLAAKIGGR